MSRNVLAGVWLFALAPALAAQLDLPKDPPPAKSPAPAGLSDPARELYERAADVQQANERARNSRARSGGLDIPAGPREAGQEGASSDVPQAPASAAVPAPASETEAWLAEMRALTTSNDRVARELAVRLAAAGAGALDAARIGIASDHAPTLLLSARVLASHGDGGDHQRIAARLAQNFQGQLGAQLLRSAATASPDAVADRTLVALLDHPQAPMRLAAERQLVQRARPELVPVLVPALHSQRAETRQRAVEVVGRIPSEAAVSALLSKLDDPASRVATRAVELLGEHPHPDVDRRLIERVFAHKTLFREQAYALLALVAREDAQGRAILDELQADLLLRNMTSALPIVSGASALALAGIGFRSDDRIATRWLDLDVPHQLVRILIAENFHKDFTALQSPARRRLTILSGQDFGGDGPAWGRWWTDEVNRFRARRAVVTWRPDDVGNVVVTWRDPGSFDEVALIGPDAAPTMRSQADAVFLTLEESRRLVEGLAAIGVFGRECPPGPTGHGQFTGAFDVRLAGQGKVFQIGDRRSPEWIAEARSLVLALREDNRWQRFYDSSRFASRRAFVEAEAPWWREPRPEEERLRRTKELALAALGGAGALERGAMVTELERLARRDGLLVVGDFQPLVDAIAIEPFYGPRAETLTRLALDAAGAGPGDAEVDPRAIRTLLETLSRAFANAARPAIEEVFAAAPVAMARTAALDHRPLMRELAADRVAAAGTPEDIDILRRLLEDRDATVEAATITAIGEHGLTALRGEVLARARLADVPVRRAALVALGRLGGDGALELLVATVGVGYGELDAAAAEGLGALRDARGVPVLMVLLHGGRAAPAFEATRTALLAIGPPAWPELMRVASTPTSPARRAAALLLAQQGVPPIVPVMISILADDPRDDEMRRELVALTGIDPSDDADPLGVWWDWWDRAPKEDSRTWLRAAQEAQGLPVGPLDSWSGEGTRVGALSLVESMERGTPALALRASRELGRLLDESLVPPQLEPERSRWFASLRERVDARWPR